MVLHTLELILILIVFSSVPLLVRFLVSFNCASDYVSSIFQPDEASVVYDYIVGNRTIILKKCSS